MKQIKNILIALLFICCFVFTSCNSKHYKEVMDVQGVVTKVIPTEDLSHFGIKAKVKVSIDVFNEEIFYYTREDVDVGDTINIEMVFCKKKPTATFSSLDEYQSVPKE